MKKSILFIVVILAFFLLLSACKTEEEGNGSIDDLKQYVLEQVHAKEGSENDSGELVYTIVVANDVDLPTENKDMKGSKITWTSIDPSSIDDNCRKRFKKDIRY